MAKKSYFLPWGKPTGDASYKSKETTSISTSGASSPPNADNTLSLTHIHIKHSHAPPYSHMIWANRFGWNIYEPDVSKHCCRIASFYIFLSFFSLPAIYIGTIFATYQNPSDVKYATRNRKMGVKRIEGVSVEYWVSLNLIWGVRADPRPPYPCQHPHIKTPMQEKPAVNLSRVLDPALPAPDPGQWAPVTSEPQIWWGKRTQNSPLPSRPLCCGGNPEERRHWWERAADGSHFSLR